MMFRTRSEQPASPSHRFQLETMPGGDPTLVRSVGQPRQLPTNRTLLDGSASAGFEIKRIAPMKPSQLSRYSATVCRTRNCAFAKGIKSRRSTIQIASGSEYEMWRSRRCSWEHGSHMAHNIRPPSPVLDYIDAEVPCVGWRLHS